MVRRSFLLALLALPACAARSVVWRRRAEDGVPHDATLFLWPVQSEDTPHRHESLASLETHLVDMLLRDGANVVTEGPAPPECWSMSIRVEGLPIPPSEPGLIPSHSVDATAVVVIRHGTTIKDVIEVTEEIRTYYSNYLPWRLARRIADVIAMRREGW